MSFIEPNLPAHSYTTYQIRQATDRFIVAACKDVGCQNWLHGWKTIVDESDPVLGREQAKFIRLKSGRTFKEQRDGVGLTVFTFAPFQRCFAEHKTMPQRFIERGGHWQLPQPISRRVHVTADDWVESFAEHQDVLKTAIERG